MDWPVYFPNDCPPIDAHGAIGQIYRFTNPTRPIENSFVCHKILMPTKDFGENTCNSCGLSVGISLENCKKAQRSVGLLKKKDIFVANFESETGLLKQTPMDFDTEHHTWWIPTEIECPWAYFVEASD